MIFVFISALALKIYTTSYAVLLVAYKRGTNFENFSLFLMDFTLFNAFIALPSIIAIYMGSRVTNRGNQFAVYVGKYASHCDDEISYRKVSGFVEFTQIFAV
jgi:hypothetical protein